VRVPVWLSGVSRTAAARWLQRTWDRLAHCAYGCMCVGVWGAGGSVGRIPRSAAGVIPHGHSHARRRAARGGPPPSLNPLSPSPHPLRAWRAQGTNEVLSTAFSSFELRFQSLRRANCQGDTSAVVFDGGDDQGAEEAFSGACMPRENRFVGFGSRLSRASGLSFYHLTWNLVRPLDESPEDQRWHEDTPQSYC